MMVGNDRGDAVYAVVSQKPGFSGLTQAEQDSVRAQLRAVWAADLGYVTGNAQILPNTLQNPSGQPVATTGGPAAQSGATTAPSTLTGYGVVR